MGRGVFLFLGGIGISQYFQTAADLLFHEQVSRFFICRSGKRAEALFDLCGPFLQGSLGSGVAVQILYTREVGFPQALQLGSQLGELFLQKCGFVHGLRAGTDDLVGNRDLSLRVSLHQCEQHFGQLFIWYVLGAFAAAPHIPIALPIVWGRKDQCAAAVGAADQTGHPAFVLCDGTAVVFPLSLDGCHAALGSTLATFLRGRGVGRNAVIRTGSLDEDGEALFRVTNTLLGEAPVARRSFAYLGKEPLFLTERGVYAITAEELTGEKYTQERSYFISSALGAIAEKEDASASIYRDFYVLAIGGDLYLLDGQQKTYERNNPYSSYQYEAYHWPGIGARLTWVEDGVLWFGTEDGKLKEFASHVDDPESYNDDGAAIDAYWETSDFDGKTFFKNKTFTSVSVRLAAAVLTGVKIYAQRRGIWSLVFDAKERARFFDWSYIDFAKFVFSADRTPRTLSGKVKIKKVDKTRFRLQNSEKNEPFGLYAFGVEWKEPGSNYKR